MLASRYRKESVERVTGLASIATEAYEEGEFGILQLLDGLRTKLLTQPRFLELSGSTRSVAVELDRLVGGGVRQ